jgi:hypothetical protein
MKYISLVFVIMLLLFVVFLIVWFLFWIWLEYTVLLNVNIHKIIHPEKYDGVDCPISYRSPRIDYGRYIASQTSIVICGLARDIKEKLVKTIDRLEYIGKKFKRYKIIVFENDSSDGTRELLKYWGEINPNVELLKCCQDGSCDCRLNKRSSYSNGILSGDRIDRMAEFRNRYLEKVKKDYSHYDWMLVSDLDLEGACSLDGLFHSMTFDYDAVALNGRFGVPGTLGFATMTYDSMAYVGIDKDVKQNIGYKDLITKILHMNWKISTTPDDELTPVKSAFNGMCLYRIPSILDKQYYPLGNCEHIGFHNGLKIGINKVWVGYAGYQGMRSFSDWHF